MEYKIVFFDIDGTLIDENKQIPPDTMQAIRALKETDTAVVIATGRAPSQFNHVATQFGIDSYVCLNGGYAQFRGKRVFGRPIEKEHLAAIEEMANAAGHPLVFAGSEACYANRENHDYVNEAFDYLDIPKKPDFDPDAWRHHDIYQVYLYCAEGDEKPFEVRFADTFRFIRPHRYYLDIFPKDVSKAGGIAAMLRELGIAKEEAMAFGDGQNDIEMLGFVGMGIAMGNASDAVKAHARFVTKDVDHGGILYALEQFGLLNGDSLGIHA